MWSEAFSQMNMAGTYTQEGNTLSLGGIPGMEGKALFAIDGQEMDLLMIFGAPGMVAPPGPSTTAPAIRPRRACT